MAVVGEDGWRLGCHARDDRLHGIACVMIDCRWQPDRVPLRTLVRVDHHMWQMIGRTRDDQTGWWAVPTGWWAVVDYRIGKDGCAVCAAVCRGGGLSSRPPAPRPVL